MTTGGTSKPTLLRLRGISGLRITGTFFKDERTSGCAASDSLADGILAYNSGFWINSPSFFFDLDRGIFVSGNSLGFGSYRVHNAQFRRCHTAIHSIGQVGFDISDNYFIVDVPEACPPNPIVARSIGVRIEGASSEYYFADNQFVGEDNDETVDYLGVLSSNTLDGEKELLRNEFSGLDYGAIAYAANAGTDGTGLQFVCNEFSEQTLADMVVYPGGKVRAVQGEEDPFSDVDLAAGNVFNQGDIVHFDNSGNAPITYYYLENATNEEPNDITLDINSSSQVIKQFTDEDNPKCTPSSGEGGCVPPCTTIGAWTSDFVQSRNAWTGTKTALETAVGERLRDSLARQIVRHRSAMDRSGALILRYYLLDTLNVKTDSVLAWTARLESFRSDLRLAKHHLFAGAFSTYDTLIAQIPLRYDLVDWQTAEVEQLDSLADLLRPFLAQSLEINRLPAEAVYGLMDWAARCSEAGFTAQGILELYSIRLENPCTGATASRSVEKRPSVSEHSTKLRLYPNPAGDQVTVEAPSEMGALELSIVSPNGRLQRAFALPGTASFDVSSLAPGLYFCLIRTQSSERVVEKLLIIR